MDKVINERGTLLVEALEYLGFFVLNDRYDDYQGKYTYIWHTGCSMIDLVCANFNNKNSILNFSTSGTLISDHLSCLVTLENNYCQISSTPCRIDKCILSRYFTPVSRCSFLYL